MRKLAAVVACALLLCNARSAWTQTAPPLGTAQTFAILAGSGIANVGPSVVVGSAGSSPTPSNGLTNAEVTGTNYTAASAVVDQAKLDLVTAYNSAAGQAATTVATELGATTLSAGVYTAASGTFGLTGVLTLDGGGNPNAVFIFQTASTLITAASSSVTLINSAQARNVFWQVGSSATLGASTALVGNILAFTSISLGASASVSGRLLARSGAVTLSTNSIALPAAAMPVLTILKSVQVFSDPVNGTSSPKAIPGAVMSYTVTVTNSGPGAVDANSTVVTDPVPVNTSLCVSATCNSPVVVFSCTACGLSDPNPANIAFSNVPGGGAPYTYTPVADVNGYDAIVTGMRISPQGVLSANPASFSVSFKVRVK